MIEDSLLLIDRRLNISILLLTISFRSMSSFLYLGVIDMEVDYFDEVPSRSGGAPTEPYNPPTNPPPLDFPKETGVGKKRPADMVSSIGSYSRAPPLKKRRKG